jgi:hypothetical protein
MVIGTRSFLAAPAIGAAVAWTTGCSSDGDGGGRPFKGVAFEEAKASCDDLGRLGVAWYHN